MCIDRIPSSLRLHREVNYLQSSIYSVGTSLSRGRVPIANHPRPGFLMEKVLEVISR